MNGLDNFISEAIFDKSEHAPFYNLVWPEFEDSGYVITDTDGDEIDAVFKAYSLKNLLDEFIYRLYDAENETSGEDVVDSLSDIGFKEGDINEYIKNNIQLNYFSDDIYENAQNALDAISNLTAKELIGEYSSDEIFDMMFCVSYDFDQDFTFDFEDSDELQAFIYANSERLEMYRDEFGNVLNWIEGGMPV